MCIIIAGMFTGPPPLLFAQSFLLVYFKYPNVLLLCCRWKINNRFINGEDSRYSMIGGNLVINNPEKVKDRGKYQCEASNKYGTIISKEAELQFGCMYLFANQEPC